MTTEYKIVEADSSSLLEADVNRLLGEGWCLHGGVFVLWRPADRKGYQDTAWWYTQAMVREAKNVE